MENTKKNSERKIVFRFATRFLRRLFPLLVSIVVPLTLSAQKTTITGVVVDSNNEPVIGASVLVKGTSTGTVTNYEGKFTIEASSNDVLVFSYIGMVPQEIKVGNSRTLMWYSRKTLKFFQKL
jgi:hypothetical protein